MREVVLFGCRSPMVVEYEESCHRGGVAIRSIVSVSGAPRSAQPALIKDIGNLQPGDFDTACIACAFSPVQRRNLVGAAQKAGFSIADALIDAAAVVASSARIGAGSYINGGAVVGALSFIGEHVLINRNSSLGHHCMVMDYVSIGPGVTIAGNVRIGADSIIGAGSTILPDLRIGAGAIVAAGSLVRDDVQEGAFVAGAPAIARPYDVKNNSLNLPDAE